MSINPNDPIHPVKRWKGTMRNALNQVVDVEDDRPGFSKREYVIFHNYINNYAGREAKNFADQARLCILEVDTLFGVLGEEPDHAKPREPYPELKVELTRGGA